MIIIITEASHSGKTLLAQKLLEQYRYPYLSVDHLKMGLIRSGRCPLSPETDGLTLTEYLWPIVREIIKTNIENKQNLIVEGCYIPFNFAEDFSAEYLREIKFICLIFSDKYIARRFNDIMLYENIIESRIYKSELTAEALMAEHRRNFTLCKKYGLDYIMIDGDYDVSRKISKYIR